MLTRELLRFKNADGRCQPHFITATPVMLELAGDLLQLWREHCGRPRLVVEEVSQRRCYQARSLQLARGLQKILVDACAFDEPEDLRQWRWRALEASAEALLHETAVDAAAHSALVADRIDCPPARLAADLYADLPEAVSLQKVPTWSPAELLRRYNRALAQGLLLSAKEIELRLPAAETGGVRAILAQLRFRRLLAEVERDADGSVLLRISGPGSVLEQRQRYGLQLAQSLPAICCAPRWQLRAQICPQRGETMVLCLDQSSGLSGENRFLGYVPPEFATLQEQLAKQRPGWRLSLEPELLSVPGSGQILVPDLAVQTETGWSCRIELFHRWHWRQLAPRLQQLAGGGLPELLLGVDRAVIRRAGGAEVQAQPEFERLCFVFSDYPTPRALVALIEARAAPAAD